MPALQILLSNVKGFPCSSAGKESVRNAGAAAAAEALQSCPTLCDPIDGSPPGSPHPWDSPGKNTGVGCHCLLCSVGDLGSIPGLGRSPGEGKGYPLQYSDLENSNVNKRAHNL